MRTHRATRPTLAVGLAGAIVAASIAAACDTGADDASGGAGASTSSSGSTGTGTDALPTFTDAERATLAEMSPDELPIPADPTNAYADDDAASALGKKLFFDPGFAGVLWEGDNDLDYSGSLGAVGDTGKVACVSCHTPTGAFADDRSLGNGVHAVSLGAGWTTRRAPSLLDVAADRLLMWDGRKDSLFSQAFGPIENRHEMNSSRLFVAERIHAEHAVEYEAIFGPLPALDDAARFPALTGATTGCQKTGVGAEFTCHGMPGDGAEFDGMAAADQDAVTRVVVNVGKAIGAYERRLVCGKSRFDAWVHGDATALTPSEQRGLKTFLGKGRCSECHTGPYLSDQAFHNVGLKAEPVVVVVLDANDPGASVGFQTLIDDPLNAKSVWSDGDDGRVPTDIPASMLGAFKTPMLRCVAKRPAFMHTGQMQDLRRVVDFFDQGGSPYGFVGTNELHALSLTDAEKDELVAFLHALDGDATPP